MKKQQNPYQQKANEYNNRSNDKSKRKPHQQKKNPHKITINVSQTQYAVVRLVAKKLKWNISTQPVSNLNFDLCWIDGHCRQQIYARMQPYQKINHFPGMEILSRKNFLGKSLMQFKKKFHEQYDFFPITWSLPTQFVNLKEHHQNRQQGRAQTFICKPEAGCQGRGIFLTRNIDKLKYQKCVVQKYMSKPLLIDGLKFDLRIYVLVAGTDPLRIFVYEEGLARFCTQKYQTPKSDNLDNKFMHLTNYAINKLSPDFVFNQDATQCDKGHKRSLTSIYKSLSQMGHNSQQIKQRINDMIIKTIITGYPTLSRFQQGSHPQNFSNDMCFQILGFDVMLNHKLNPFIIQINYTPSFTTDTPFDKLVKKNLIYDTMKLLNISEKWKRQVRRKRQGQLKQRMLTGKRTKYTQQQRQQLIQKHVKLRDQHQAQNLGGFTKIFCKSQQQMLRYGHYYQFAEMMYQKQNKLTGVTTSKNLMPFYIPYAKSPKHQSQKQQQFRRTGFSSAKAINRKINTRQQGSGPRSIQNRRMVTSAKVMMPRSPILVNQYLINKSTNKNGEGIKQNPISGSGKSLKQVSVKIQGLQQILLRNQGSKVGLSGKKLSVQQKLNSQLTQNSQIQNQQSGESSSNQSEQNEQCFVRPQNQKNLNNIQITNL